MNDTYIVTGYVVIDSLLILIYHQDDTRTESPFYAFSESEVVVVKITRGTIC